MACQSSTQRATLTLTLTQRAKTFGDASHLAGHAASEQGSPKRVRVSRGSGAGAVQPAEAGLPAALVPSATVLLLTQRAALRAVAVGFVEEFIIFAFNELTI